MFIYHFNRLIHNKILWGSFAFIIALMFGLSFGSASFSSCQGGDAAAGRLDGKPVSNARLDEAMSAVRVMERQRNASGEASLPNETVFTQALVRIAKEQLANRHGLAVTTPEIQSQIRQEPAFQANGVFSMDAYSRVLPRSIGMSIAQFENLTAQDIAGAKINAIIQSASWVSTGEIEDQLANFTDRLGVRYAFLQDKFADSAIQPSEQQLQDYYDNNPGTFEIPAKTSVAYVAIPFTNYTPRITITMDDLREYYEDNIENYTRFEEAAPKTPKDDGDDENTGDREDGDDVAGDTETENGDDAENEPVVVVQPLEEVTAEITAVLQEKFSREAAETNAVLSLLDIASGPGGLQAVADLFGLQAATTGLFGYEGPDGFENPVQFARLANEYVDEDGVIPETFDMFMGDTTLYIFSPSAFTPAHVPPFEDVRDRVVILATAKAKADAFQEQLEAVHASIQAALDAGQTFDEAATAAGLSATNATLCVNDLAYTPAQPFPEARNIAFTAMTLPKGRLAKPTPIPLQGAALIYLEDREPGDPLALDYVRGELQKQMMQNQVMFINSQWNAWFANNLHYVPAHAAASTAEYGDDDE